MICFVRFARSLAALLAPLLRHLHELAAVLYRRHRTLLHDEPTYRAQTRAGTAALLTLLRIPRPLATQLLGALRRTTRTQLEPIPDDPTTTTEETR